MKSSKKTLFIAIGLLLIIVVFKNTTFSYNKTESSYSTIASWPEEVKKYSTKDGKGNRGDLSIIVLLKKDTLYKEISKTKPIVITVNSLETGALWVPLYKSIDYTAVGALTDIRSKVPVQLTTMGHVSMTGNYSSKQAKAMINKDVAESFVKEIKNHFYPVQ
ncbi:hypothetical protein SNE26_23175 [Mucilaginibacter sp. cycad4]|uniref:hypothetical protein n=1 Tax=Mucilaginibacter sp. cycad4 TaxID=3342096 RepID=UPI002AAB0F1D|nr:hypothetical protein [Mucilaginibacter gossypii]WPU98918.1 hypothetical protein SNE26_23175 [Mucilaginibacter gossypii]